MASEFFNGEARGRDRVESCPVKEEGLTPVLRVATLRKVSQGHYRSRCFLP